MGGFFMRKLINKIENIIDDLERKMDEKDELVEELHRKVTKIMLEEGFDKGDFSLRFDVEEKICIELKIDEISLDSLVNLQEKFNTNILIRHDITFCLVLW